MSDTPIAPSLFVTVDSSATGLVGEPVMYVTPKGDSKYRRDEYDDMDLTELQTAKQKALEKVIELRNHRIEELPPMFVVDEETGEKVPVLDLEDEYEKIVGPSKSLPVDLNSEASRKVHRERKEREMEQRQRIEEYKRADKITRAEMRREEILIQKQLSVQKKREKREELFRLKKEQVELERQERERRIRLRQAMRDQIVIEKKQREEEARKEFDRLQSGKGHYEHTTTNRMDCDYNNSEESDLSNEDGEYGAYRDSEEENELTSDLVGTGEAQNALEKIRKYRSKSKNLKSSSSVDSLYLKSETPKGKGSRRKSSNGSTPKNGRSRSQRRNKSKGRSKSGKRKKNGTSSGGGKSPFRGLGGFGSPESSSKEHTTDGGGGVSSNAITGSSSPIDHYSPSQSAMMSKKAREAGHRSFPRKLKRGVNYQRARALWEEHPLARSEQGEYFRRGRYTSITLDRPRELQYHHVLRCEEYYPSEVKNLIVVTMYNESYDQLRATLIAICENLRQFEMRYGQDVWKQFCVCIVSDGREKANRATLQYAEFIGIYDEQVMHENMKDEVTMHLFESCITLPSDAHRGQYYPPLQTMFCLKEHNAGKVNSHLWFFYGMAETLLPTYTFTLDVGTMPDFKAIMRLYEALEDDKQIGGVAGEIAVYDPNVWNPIVAAQVFEYKISHILDKAQESVFGYISVLPGAFSAYRYSAIRPSLSESRYRGPLVSYFEAEEKHPAEIGPFKSNMYLAEDRILCFEIAAQKNEAWLLRYVKNAVAYTDVPDTLPDLINQRRRWLNGSFFALLFAIMNFPRLVRDSSHSFSRKASLSFLFLFHTLTVIMSWFLCSNFFLAFFFVLKEMIPSKLRIVRHALTGFYIFITAIQFIIGFGNRAQAMSVVYHISCILYAGLMAVSLTLGVQYILNTPSLPVLLVSAIATGVYVVAPAIHGLSELGAVLSCFIQYFLMLPTFVNVFTIRSFCNINDISWGTKGLEAQKQAARKKETETKKKKKNKRKKDSEHSSSISVNPLYEGIPPDEIDPQVEIDEKFEKRNQTFEKKKLEVDPFYSIQQVRDRFEAFRSFTVIAWIITNGAFTSSVINFIPSNVYLNFLFFAVCFFNSSRLLGSVSYILHRMCVRYNFSDRREKRILDAALASMNELEHLEYLREAHY